MSSKKSKKTKKKAQRAASNVFAMFDQQTIQEFKEAFNMIDVGRDGFIDKADLNETFINLGKMSTDDELESMITEAPGQINFTVFLTLFGDRLNGTDPEDVIRHAFGCFDVDGSGKIHEDKLRDMLMHTGERSVYRNAKNNLLKFFYTYLRENLSNTLFFRTMHCGSRPKIRSAFEIF